MKTRFGTWLGVPLGLAALWWLLTDGDPASWAVGLPFVAVAAFAAYRARPAGGAGLSPVGIVRFIPMFLRESLRGGVDVARRVLGREVRVAPTFVRYPLRLRTAGAQVMFVNVISLLPGSLAADLRAGHIEIHLLDGTLPVEDELRRLEAAVGRVHGEAL